MKTQDSKSVRVAEVLTKTKVKDLLKVVKTAKKAQTATRTPRIGLKL